MGEKGLVLPAAAAAAAAAVDVGADDGMGDGMLCSEHPQYSQRANPGAICALCLQEKLGRLVSSSPSNSTSNKSSSHFFPSALAAAPPYSSDSPSSPLSSASLRPTVVEAVHVPCHGARAAGGARTSSFLSSYDTGRHLSSSGNRAGGSGRSRMIPFLYTTHGMKKKSSGSGGSTTTTTTTRTSSSTASRKVMSSTTSSSSLSAISTTTASSSSGSCSGGNPVFKRSKSVAPRPTGGAITEVDPEKFDSPRKKSFWSFLYHSSSSPRSTSSMTINSGSGAAKRRGAGGGGGRKDANGSGSSSTSATAAVTTSYIRDIKLLPQPPQLPVISTTTAAATTSNSKPQEDAKTPRREYPSAVPTVAATTVRGGEEADDYSPGSGSQASASFGRKVARSRSVGCGSRSFSGDFLERISTGFGDCTLRRVESQREAKPPPGKIVTSRHNHRGPSGEEDQELPPQRVRCGGIFGAFSSSSSSSYWLSDDLGSGNSGVASGRISTIAAIDGSDSGTPHARRSWAAWAFASPMRAFRPSSSSRQAVITSINGAVRATGRAAATSAAPSAAATTTGGAAALLAVKG